MYLNRPGLAGDSDALAITIRIFSSAENRRRVLRRIYRTAFSAEVFFSIGSFSFRSSEPSLVHRANLSKHWLKGHTAGTRTHSQ